MSTHAGLFVVVDELAMTSNGCKRPQRALSCTCVSMTATTLPELRQPSRSLSVEHAARMKMPRCVTIQNAIASTVEAGGAGCIASLASIGYRAGRSSRGSARRHGCARRAEGGSGGSHARAVRFRRAAASRERPLKSKCADAMVNLEYTYNYTVNETLQKGCRTSTRYCTDVQSYTGTLSQQDTDNKTQTTYSIRVPIGILKVFAIASLEDTRISPREVTASHPPPPRSGVGAAIGMSVDYHAFPQKAPNTSFAHLLILTAVALVSGIANGYNGTVLEGAIPRMRAVGVIQSTFETGLLVGALSLGGLLGSLACTELAYRLSRRKMVMVGETIIIASVLTFTFATRFEVVLIGRTFTGFGVGICGLAKPLIVSELAPPDRRGFLVSLFAVGQSIGMNLFYVTDWGMPGPVEAPWIWRPLISLGALPAAIVVLIAMVTPSTSYWDVAPSQATAAVTAADVEDLSPGLRRVGATDDAPLQLLKQLCSRESWTTRRNFLLILALMLGYNLSGERFVCSCACLWHCESHRHA